MSCLPSLNAGLKPITPPYSPASNSSFNWDTDELLERHEQQEPLHAAVLIVEDSFINAKIAFNALQRFIPGNHIIWVDRAEQAQAALTGAEFIAKNIPSQQKDSTSRIRSSTQFDLAILDFDLSSPIDGIDVAKAVRRHEQLNLVKRVNLLTFTSHYGRGQQLNEEHQTLFEGILPKPFNLEEINTKIKCYIDLSFWRPISFTPSLGSRSLSRKSISPQTTSSLRLANSPLTSPLSSPASSEEAAFPSMEKLNKAFVKQLQISEL